LKDGIRGSDGAGEGIDKKDRPLKMAQNRYANKLVFAEARFDNHSIAPSCSTS
jgi:hypothetical protein